MALLLVIAHLVAPENSFASAATNCLVAFDIAFLFVAAGVYSVLTGVSLFYRRVQATKAGAVSGLLAGLIVGALIAACGVVGFFRGIR